MSTMPPENQPPFSQPPEPAPGADLLQRGRSLNDPIRGNDFVLGHDLQQRLDALTISLNEVTRGLGEAGNLFGDISDHLTKSVEAVTKLSDGSNDVAKHTEKEATARAKASVELEKQKKIQDQIHKAQLDGPKAIRDQLRQHGMYSTRKGRYRIPGEIIDGEAQEPEYLTPKQLTDRLKGDPNSPEYQRVIQGLQHNMKAETNVPTFRIGEFIKAAASGNLGRAVGEAMQPFGFAGRIGGSIENAGERLSARAASGGVLGRLGMGSVGGILSRFGPMLGGLIGPGAIGIGQQVLSRVMGQVNQTRELGAITGSGVEEGLGARAHAFITGLNPFDLVSNKDALAAQRAVREAGYSSSPVGRDNQTANSVADIVTDMRNRMGIPIKDAADLVVVSLKDAGMTMDQTRAEMMGLHDATRDAHSSITDWTTALKEAIPAVAAMSRESAGKVTPLAESMARSFAGTHLGRSPKLFTAIISGTQQRQLLGALHGVAPGDVYTAKFDANFTRYLDLTLLDLAKGKLPGQTWTNYADWLYVYNPIAQQMFQQSGWQADDLGDAMHRVWQQTNHGRNTRNLDRQQKMTFTQTGAATQRSRVDSIFKKRSDRRMDALTHGRQPGDLDGGLTAKERQQLNPGIRTWLAQSGLTKEEQKMLMEPILQAEKSGNQDDIKTAINFARHEAFRKEQGKDVFRTETHGHQKVHVVIDMPPDIKRLLRSSTYEEWIHGARGSQGVTKP